MDFVTHLPNSFGHTTIWVICDRLTKYVHFLALPTKYTASDLAARFSVEICRLHGVPKSIISDRDPLFLSSFWKELFRLQGTTLKYSTSYHPETDGQSEAINRCLEAYLRCFAGDQPCKWYKFLHLVEYWYNSAFHSAIGMSPFQALYGRPPPKVLDYVPGSSTIKSVDTSLQKRHEIMNTLTDNLKRNKQRMEDQANKNRKDCTFEPDDWVLLRLQPYRQQTVVRRSSQKLSKRDPQTHFKPLPAELKNCIQEESSEPNGVSQNSSAEQKALKSGALIQTEQAKPSDLARASGASVTLPRASLNRTISKESTSQHTPSNAHSQPCDALHYPMLRSEPLKGSTIRVTPFDNSKGASPSLDSTQLSQAQSQPLAGSTIRVLDDKFSNLEDKVSSAEGGIDSKWSRPKRNIQRPFWLKDFI
ncbi:Ribonuclease H-like superfamily [Sesbania bispinosa]|nr:Ribonuclease H-like superfamily [Sesbania bispinosa]